MPGVIYDVMLSAAGSCLFAFALGLALSLGLALYPVGNFPELECLIYAALNFQLAAREREHGVEPALDDLKEIVGGYDEDCRDDDLPAGQLLLPAERRQPQEKAHAVRADT